MALRCCPPPLRRVSARDTGKVMVDAILGEIVTTCEKIHWLISEGEKWLKPERRSAGLMVGVGGAGVPLPP